MYLWFLKLISGTSLFLAFCPALRVSNVSLFDWMTPLVIVLSLLYHPKEAGVSLGSFKLALSGIALLALAGVVSAAQSYDPVEHITKVIYLVVALSGIAGLGYVLVSRKILTLVQAQTLLSLSAAASSAVCILQGRFGLLRGLMDPRAGLANWTRMTGLGQHPIETGDISSFGVIVALGLALYTRRWRFFLFLVAIDVYSFVYSASLTALLALGLGLAAMCIFTRAYKLLVLACFIGILGLGLAFLFSSDTHLLTSRLEVLSHGAGDYETVRSREMQWGATLSLIGPTTLLAGNGYSAIDLPYEMDIHNVLLASIYHFGVIGLVSQVLLIWFFGARLWCDGPRELRGMLLGCVVIFVTAAFTGPALSRRSLWVPPMVLGAYLSTVKATTLIRSKRSSDEPDAEEPKHASPPMHPG